MPRRRSDHTTRRRSTAVPSSGRRSTATPPSDHRASSSSSSSSSSSRLSATLLAHQKQVVRYLLNHRGALVFHGMGSGKTRIAVVLGALLKKPCLVVLPASLRENFWQEVRKIKASPQLFRVMSAQAFLDTTLDCRGHILVIDEAHTLRNADGKISQKVQACAEQADKVLLLTGTPLVNRPSDIAPLLNMIVKGKIHLPVKTGLFTTRVFTDIPTDDQFVATLGEDGLNAVGRALWKELFPCLLSYYATPATPDFPTMVTHVVEVPMAPEQERVYTAWEKRSLTPAMVAMLSRAHTLPPDLTKLPQFKAYLDGGRRICNAIETDRHELVAPKFTRMIERLAQAPGKALVYSQYLERGVAVAERLLQERGLSYVKFTGQETDRQKKDAVDRYNRNQVRVFLLSPAGGMGLDLHDTSTVHIMEPGWNEALILQAIYRAVRYKSHTQPHAVVQVYRYVCRKAGGGWGRSPSPSSDVYLQDVARRKEQINRRFLDFALQHSMEHSDAGACVWPEL